MCLITAFETHVRASATPTPDGAEITVSRGDTGQVLVDVTGPSFIAASDHAIAVIDGCAEAELEDTETGRARPIYAHGTVIRDADGAPTGYRCVFDLDTLPAATIPVTAGAVPMQAALR
ncbi:MULTISPECIES: hypothetical protein [unclassified Marinovum]